MTSKATKTSCKTLEARSIPTVRGETIQLVLSPDGSLLGSVGVCSDMRIYDTKTWELRAAFKLGQTEVTATHGLQFSPDGRKLYEITSDHVRRFSIPKPGEEIMNHFQWDLPCVNQSAHWIKGRAISPDCTKVLVCGDGHIAKVYDAQTGKFLDEYSFKNNRYVLFGPIFSPDGKRIALPNNASKVFVLDLENKLTQEIPLPKGDSYLFNWSPDGKFLLVGNAKKLFFVDANDGKIAREINVAKRDIVYAVLSSDQKQCLLGISQEKSSRLQLIDVETEKVLFEKEIANIHEFFSLRATFIESDSHFVVGGQDLSVVETKTTNIKKTIEGHQGQAFGFLFTPDEKSIILADSGTGRIIDPKTGDEVGRISDTVYLKNHKFISPDGKTLLAYIGSDYSVFDLSSKKLIKKFAESGVNCGLVISPDFSMVAGGQDANRVVYRLPSVKKLYEFKGIKGKQPESIAFSPDSKQLIIADWSPGVQLLNATNGKVLKKIEFATNEAEMPEAGFLGDGTRFFVKLHSQQMSVYETATFAQLVSFPINELPFQAGKSIKSTPDGVFGLLEARTKQVEVFEWATGKIVRSDVIGKQKYSSVVSDLSHNRLYYGCQNGTIEVVQTTDWKCVQTVEAVGTKIDLLNVSPDGKRLAVYHSDGVDIFDTDSFEKTAMIPADKTVRRGYGFVEFSPNWHFATKCNESELLIFDLP